MTLYKNTGLVLEGGGFRGIFTSAVLELLHQNEIFFSYAVGVSAGAAYGVSYVSRQKGRNLETNQYINHPMYCGWRHWIKSGNFFNWNFIYKTIPTQIIPLDYTALANSETRFDVVVTNCKTSKPEYLDANTSNPDELCEKLTATSSLPFISRMKALGQLLYLDGGLSDPIPFKHAFSKGNKKVVIVLTRQAEYRKKNSKGGFFFNMVYRKYPELTRLMKSRVQHYNNELADIEQLESGTSVFVIRPPEPVPVDRLENNPEVLETYYKKILQQMQPEIDRLKQWLENPL